MKLCPECGVTLDPAKDLLPIDSSLVECRHCGAILPAISSSAQTVSDLPEDGVAKTIDSLDFSSQQDLGNEAKTVVDELDDEIAQTIDSIDIPQPDDGIQQTIESVQLGKSDDDVEQTDFSVDGLKSRNIQSDKTLPDVDAVSSPDDEDGQKTVSDLEELPRTIESMEFRSQGGPDENDDNPQTVASIDPNVQNAQTIPEDLSDSPVAQTIDSITGSSVHDVKTLKDAEPQEDSHYWETLDSEVFSDSGERSSGYDATLDSHGSSLGSSIAESNSTLDSEIPREMQQLWGSSIMGAKPDATINTKGRRNAVKSISSLTIQPREVGTSHKVKPAELDYDLKKKLGQGGMGLVFSARQSSLDRHVAVKMLRPDVKVTSGQERKFVSEAVVTGELEHPGIIPIYDMGCTSDGTLFYSMKQVHGTPWSKVIRNRPLVENLETLMRVCDAMAFAHSRDVIHRDLKPENIMLGEFGEVLVLDWGLAVTVAEKPTSESIARISNMGGTPAYMSPEMATGPLEKIGKHSDIYLLGAILYEIITGKLPRRSRTSIEALALAARNKIERTRKKGELVDIARRAMATNPSDRYQSVKDFQHAIREYQNHSESTSLSTRAADDLKTALETDEYQDYAKALFGFEEAFELWEKNVAAKKGISRTRRKYAESALRKEDFDFGLSLLDEDNTEHHELIGKLRAGLDERTARINRLRTARRVTFALAVSVFLAVSIGSVLVWQAKQAAQRNAEIAEAKSIEAKENEDRAKANADLANKRKAEADKSAEEARANAELANERKMEADKSAEEARANAKQAKENADEAERNAMIAKENAEEAKRNEKEAQKNLAEAVRQQKKAMYETYVALIGLAAVKIEERAFTQAIDLLKECPEHLRNWEWGRLKYLCDLRDGYKPLETAGRIESVAFDKSGDLIATADQSGHVRVYERASGQQIASVDLPTGANSIDFCPSNAKLLAIGVRSEDGLFLWDRDTGKLRQLKGHTDAVLSVRFSPHDPAQLLTTSKDRSARLWDTNAAKQIQAFLGHSGWVWSADFHPKDNTQIATASEDGTARVWDTRTGQERLSDEGEPEPFRGHGSPVFAVKYSPDGSKVASGGFDQRVLLWKPGELRAFDFDSLLSGNDVLKQTFVALEGHSASVSSIEFSADGRLILSGSHDNTLRLWSAANQLINGQAFTEGMLWKTLRGHSSLVRDVAFSPKESKLIASGSRDGFVRLWNFENYEEERFIPDIVLRGHTDAIFMAEFAANGEFVVTASRDRTARSWNQVGQAESTELREGHLFLVSSGQYYPDGRRLLTAAGDGTVKVWDGEKATELFTLPRTGFLAAAALSRTGRWIVTGKDPDVDAAGNPLAEQKSVVAAIWHGDSGDPLRYLRGHAAPISAIAISFNEKTAATADIKGRINLTDIASGKQTRLESWHVDKITAAQFVANDSVLLTASLDKTIGQWTLAGGQPTINEELTLKHSHAVTAMSASPDGELVLTGDDQGNVFMWKRQTAELVWQSSLAATQQGSDSSHTTSVSISPNGKHCLAVIASRGQQEVIVWETTKSPEQPSLRKRFVEREVWSATFDPAGDELLIMGGDEATALSLQGETRKAFSPHRTVLFASYSPDAKFIITSAWDGTARIWNRETGEAVQKLDVAKLLKKESSAELRVESAVYSTDGKQILTACNNGLLVLWDAAKGEPIRTLANPKTGLAYANFSSNGKFALGACKDGAARVWDLHSGKVMKTLAGHKAAVLHATFSHDNRLVATSGEDGEVVIWDVAQSKALMRLKGHTAAVTSSAFSPDGKRLLTGSRDQTAKLWDITSGPEDEADAADDNRDGKEILTLRGHHRQAVTSVAFSSNGKRALTSSLDGTAVIWPSTEWSD